MVRRMAFAQLGALIANVGAEPAEGFGSLGGPADESSGKDAYVGAIAAKLDTTCHQIIVLVMLYADHVVCACFAHLRA